MPQFRPLSVATVLAALVAAATPALAQSERGLAGAYLAARAAVISGDHREAAAYFERALAADPGNPVLVSNAIFANVALGRWEDAAGIAGDLPPEANGQELASLARFVQTLRGGDLAAARSAIEAGQGGGPIVDSLARGWIALGEGTMDRAEEAFRALAEEPGLSDLAWLHLGLARAAVGDFEAADEILSSDRVGRIGQTERVLQARAQILVQLGRRAEALDLLDGYTQAVPDPALLALQARIGAGAEEPYGFVTTAQEGLAEVFFTAAQAFATDESGSLSLIYARAAYAIAPDHTDAMLLAGQILLGDGQFDLAAEAYDLVPEGDDQYVEAQMGRAEALERMGNTADALQTLTALAEARPDLASVHAALGDLLRRDEQCDRAIDSYTAALDLVDTTQDRYWFLFYARAICYHQIDDWPPAEADFRYALELNPGQPQVLNYLGYSLVEQRRNLDEALAMIEEAVAARPDSGYIVDSLAWVYYRLGRFEEAVEPMERAVELLPTDPIINDHLGDVYWMVGRQREARFQWERALSLEPTEEDAERIRLKLDIGLDRVLEQEGGVGEIQ
jgi:tetratricopeptide (TPR) repeat protein